MITDTMRAIVLDGFGGLDRLVYTDLPKPEPQVGEVVIAIKGFGINHAEMHMRRGDVRRAVERHRPPGRGGHAGGCTVAGIRLRRDPRS